jgi:pyruvate/2-oxoglutarate dehydrogenase complex dihydrolipoamide dehydrogenase (E3) component
MTEFGNMEPMDTYNQALLNDAHPPEWENPIPAGPYQLVVIGGGTAGLVTAAGAAGLGAKVALVERHLLGGDCLNVGCVPSKCLIRSARAFADVRDAGQYGINVPDGVEVDFGAVMERMRRLRSTISPHDSARRFRSLGIDVYFGSATFESNGVVDVGGTKLRYAKAAICTGARAAEPPIPGLAEAGYLTNDTVFSLTERPERLAVLGAGPIGCELAQAFQRLGCQVTVVQRSGQILTREDRDAAALVEEAMVRDGVDLRLNTTIDHVTASDAGKELHVKTGGEDEVIVVDEVLLGLGRAPNVQGLGLEAVGVEYDERSGVHVNDKLRTTNPKIYAAGDVCMRYKFTHAADAAARILIGNALLIPLGKVSGLTIPWCTYTDPEIAHVGLYEKDAAEQGIEIDTYVREFKDVDRAITEGETDGLLKVHTRKGKDQILGATIVARHAGEMISEMTTAIAGKIGLGKLASVIHPYPTQAEAMKQVADAYNRTRLTPLVSRIFKQIIKWRC